MYHARQPFVIGIATAAIFSLLLTLGCSSKSDSDETFTASASAPTAVMGAAGSTFLSPLMEKWVNTYQQIHPGVQINYRPIGSGAGIEEMKKGYLSFGASDAPLSDDQAKDGSITSSYFAIMCGSKTPEPFTFKSG